MEAAQINLESGAGAPENLTAGGGARDRDRVETLQDDPQPEPESPVHAGAEEIPSEDEVASASEDLPPPTKAVSELEQLPVVPQVSETEKNTVNGNNTGKRRYERLFLMKLKDLPVCKEVPPSLKNSVFVKDGGHTPGSQGRRSGNYHYSRQPDNRVVLHKAEKRWMPMLRGYVGDWSAEEVTADLYHKFQGILNKLTPQKFQALAEQALNLEIDTEERLNGCIDIIFSRALNEQRYSIIYANLCKVMNPIKVEYQSEDGKVKRTNFRRILLAKCQKEFEKGKKDNGSMDSTQKEIDNAETDAKRAALKEELESAFTKSRKRSLGNIRFIGELFKLQMLSETIMHECITRLLKSTSDEESLECFAKLITMTGKYLDKEQAKHHHRMDPYFKRITGIIKKGKVTTRIRFMLQDVLELREKNWFSQIRQDQQLMTIDQIHAEAAIEVRKKKIAKNRQVIVNGAAGGSESRRVSEDSHIIEDIDHHRGERDNFDRTKLNKLITSNRKDKGRGGHGHLGPQAVLRPGWKKNGPSTQTSEGSKLGGKAVTRLTMNPRSKSKPHTHASMQRKLISTIDELVLSKDYKEAIYCVKEINLPRAMRQVIVTEGINHTLERKAVFRTVTGELFSRLVQEKIITQQDFSHGLNEVLEGAEDMCIDVPKFWDYLGEVLAPVFAQENISLSILRNPPTLLLVSGRAAVLVAKVLCHCVSVLKGEEEVKGLWTRCGLTWDDLGKPKEDLEEFLDRQNIRFLLEMKILVTREWPPALLMKLCDQLKSSSTSNDDIIVWIKSNCSEQECDPAVLVSNLTSVVVQASVSGSGDQAVFNQDCFERRIEVVKGQGHHGLAVLHGLQCSVAKLSHPPKLFHNLLNMTYDTELFEEQDFYNWLQDDRITYGKGAAIASARPFLDWLKSDGGYILN